MANIVTENRSLAESFYRASWNAHKRLDTFEQDLIELRAFLKTHERLGLDKKNLDLNVLAKHIELLWNTSKYDEVEHLSIPNLVLAFATELGRDLRVGDKYGVHDE